MTKSNLPENWSYNLVDSQFDFADSGLRFRQSRSGPEEEMIRSFLAKLNSRAEADVQLTIFKEPCIETGFPDLVGVSWHLPTAETWNKNRLLLKRADFRVLHRLLHFRDADHRTHLNLFDRRSWSSFQRLEAASMISLDNGDISVAPLSSLYAVRHIFAIEAKIGAWRKALHQAFLNRWFATSSHVLLPRMPSNTRVNSEAKFLGVGLWSLDFSKITIKLPQAQSDPVSYVSWLFNDWAWKARMHSSSSYEQPNHSLLG